MAQLYEQLQHPNIRGLVGFVGFSYLFCFLVFVFVFFFFFSSSYFMQWYGIPSVVRNFLQSSGLHKILCEVFVSGDKRVCNETVLTNLLIIGILVLGNGDRMSRNIFFASTNIKICQNFCLLSTENIAGCTCNYIVWQTTFNAGMFLTYEINQGMVL